MSNRGKYLTSVLLAVSLTGAWAAPARAAFATTPDVLPGFNGTVLAVAYSGNTLYVGGDFTSAVVKGKAVARSRLAAVDARTGALLPWSPAADGRVKALAVSGSSVFAAGDFGVIGGQKRDSLARLDATSGSVAGSFRHSVTGRPYALAAANGRLYVGGTISAVDGQNRTRLAAFKLSSGALDPAWKPAVDNQVETITATGARIYLGGRFQKINGIGGYARLAAVDPSAGKVVSGFKPMATVITYGIAIGSDGRLYTAHGGQGGRINAYTAAGALRWTGTFDGDAQAIAVYGDAVYVGGHFDKACRTARTGSQGVCLDGSDVRVKLAALRPADGKLLSWTANGNGVDGVLTMATTAAFGGLAAGGAFTTVNGRSAKRLAQFS